ncbi:diguanylate cyclase [Maridesulfovibrio sp. FT414]|uniref:sensor domain-containing diguanylate cyclase n=1 Tax=Maridesulfovibrio sp. FT414 TaxID=2979469 RepID=UPI003D80052B
MAFELKLKPLLIVSAVIIISDLLFIAVNYYSSLNAIQEDTRRWTREVEHVFLLSLENKATSMQQLASFVANMPKVEELFQEAEKAHETNINGKNDALLASLRSKLYEYVKPSWVEMMTNYDIRQLHFHFGPGSTSFLRVHRPEKFGDNMDQVRFTVVDVNRLHKSVKGFETGRVYSGIRGVVPVFVKSSAGQSTQIGALEAGTSFKGLLKAIHDGQDCEIAVLLTRNHIQKNMWPDFIKDHFKDDSRVGSYFIESSSIHDAGAFLTQNQVLKLLETGAGSDFITGNQVWQVGVFPLRDYRSSLDSTLDASGVVVFWRDATELWELLRRGLWINILYSLIALIVVETVLIFGWRLSQDHLNKIIHEQTYKLREMATHDGLTGILNRKAIEKKIVEEVRRAARYDSKFSIILFDVDHFKAVNDTYGHNAGDEVLKTITSCVSGLIRTEDQLGRWGGEEFLLLSPETPLKEGIVLAERIRKAIEELAYISASPVTVSLGIAQYRQGESVEDFVRRADTALYKAKESGRNRTRAAA